MSDTRASGIIDLHTSTARRLAPTLVSMAVLSLAAMSGVHAATSPDDLAAFADAQLSAAYPAGEPGAAALVRWKGKVALRKGMGSPAWSSGCRSRPSRCSRSAR